MQAPIQAVIFDCDGTLVDSEELGVGVLVELAAEEGLALPMDVALREFRGGKLAECVEVMERRAGKTFGDDFIPRVRARTAEVFRERLRPMEGALELVRAMNLPFCVASSGPPEKIALSLGLTGLLPHFEGKIFSSYAIGSWKPEPGLFLHAARNMGVAPDHCAVVEDSRFGIDAGLAAGMQVFAYVPSALDFELPREVTVVRRLAELHAWFGR